ncbi:MAG: SpoIIE family protein phosphatase [Deltaproteobacteria bacterium]|nr:SpoIIE family protein phosphatase [Deltaproteobacteria bacterium]
MPAAPKRTEIRRSLATRLSLLIIATSSIIFLVAFGYNYYVTRDIVLKEVRERARNITLGTSYRIETILRGVDDAPRYLASLLEQRTFVKDDLLKLVANVLNTSSDIYGSTAAFEPYAYDPSSRYFAPYYCRDNGGLKLVYLGGASYQYFNMDWYRVPKETGKPAWSEPYFDEGAGQIVMSTYSVPFYRHDGDERAVAGVVTADVSLEGLKDIVSAVTMYQSGYAFLISRKGVFVTHPDRELIMRESIFGLAKKAGDENLLRIGEDMVRGGEGFVSLKGHVTGKKSWMYFAPMSFTGWSIGLIFPEEELFADVRMISVNILVIGTAGTVLLLLVVIVISAGITRPIRELAAEAGEIAGGNLDMELSRPERSDEVGELALSFDNMRASLKEYIVNLRETTAAKERMESELKVARAIQMNFIPRKFPPFPDKKSFELYAALEPAREVCGDLYDYFLLDDDHLFFSIGDVSDKGIHAALFMVVTKTLMKGAARSDMEPSEILAMVNRELCRENESVMFVSLFCGILNVRTGELRYSSAGHNPPIIVAPGGTPEWLSLPEACFLGIFEDISYETRAMILEPGETLIAYTDGITEALNGGKAFYSGERLLGESGKFRQASAEVLVREILRSVHDFVGGEPPSDDITLLALRYIGFQDG